MNINFDFNKTILITDADGTLLTDDKRVLDIDKAAIDEFISEGGLFTIATGRGVTLARAVAEELGLHRLSLPAIVFNGAAVYDFEREQFLWKCRFEEQEQVRGYVERLLEQFPGVGAEILIDDKVYVVATNEYEEEHIAFGIDADSDIGLVRCPLSEVPEWGWIKVLFVDAPERIDEVIAFVAANPCERVHIVRSAPMFYEMLPQGVNKGSGLAKMLEIMNLRERYTVAVGDYMNDLEMLGMSDLGVAVGNAEQVVKDAADVVVCDNNSGIARQVVEHLRGK